MISTIPTPVVDSDLVDGIHLNVPFEQYLRWRIMSQSVLKEGRASMAHLKAAYDGERVKEVTDDMTLGTALHCAFLEPTSLINHVALWEGKSRRGVDWECFKAEHEGKAILTPAYHEKLIGMIGSLRRHPRVFEWLRKIEHTEVSIIGKVNGVRMKARCDAMTTDPLVDLKKVRSTDKRTIQNTIMTFGYHIQAAIYRELFNRERFMLICVEGTPPYDVVAKELTPEFIAMGQIEATRLLADYKQCLAKNEWPGRSDELEMIDMPEWASSGQITLDGESAFDEE